MWKNGGFVSCIGKFLLDWSTFLIMLIEIMGVLLMKIYLILCSVHMHVVVCDMVWPWLKWMLVWLFVNAFSIDILFIYHETSKPHNKKLLWKYSEIKTKFKWKVCWTRKSYLTLPLR